MATINGNVLKDKLSEALESLQIREKPSAKNTLSACVEVGSLNLPDGREAFVSITVEVVDSKVADELDDYDKE